MPEYGGEVSDLLTGNIRLSDDLDTDAFLADAASEMSGRIGTLYDIDSLVVADLAAHVQEVLKLIHVRLASGNIIMESAGGSGQDSELNAYGLYLVGLSRDALTAIVEGEFELGAPVNDADEGNRAPHLTSYDDSSAVDVFSDFTMAGWNGYWIPGSSGS